MNGKYDSTIDLYVPEGVELTEIQQEYLKVVAGLFRVKDPVKMIDVAHFMNKPTGTVYTAMKTLSAKGILETDSKGVITIYEKNNIEKSGYDG